MRSFIRNRVHAAATAPPDDPWHEVLALVTAEQDALEKGMRELLRVRKPTEEHIMEYCRMKANHTAVLKKKAEVCRARGEPVARLWLTLWEVQKNKLPLPGGEGESEGRLVGQRVRVHGLQGQPELNGSQGFARAFDASRGRYALELCDPHGDHAGETILVRPANLEPGVVWEVEEQPGRWAAFEPPDLQESIEGLYSMGSPHYLYTPGDPECEGKYEKAALPGGWGCIGRSPPPSCATHRIVFTEMREQALYVGTSRKVRRRGRPPTQPSAI